ncbi:hypothetical protein RhiirC2_779756 [Rhizophagus irregularis]|uniref:Uncharacterized protein n=1 Tax=Rhizophagus irregularis TaxID=588596 RepID=A0A2N1N906_9GLOM|nr:hypothetical protein RhiirC2_779756 [Rhizophagus irregularis]
MRTIWKQELQKLFQTEVKVVINIPLPLLIDYDFQEFNMEEMLDRTFYLKHKIH